MIADPESASIRPPSGNPPPAGSGVCGQDQVSVLPFRGRQALLLAAITALAAVLRLLHLGDWSIWVDEAHTWRDVTVPFDEFQRGGTSWYPTSFLLLRWLMAIGWLEPFTEGWLRLPFAFCGIVTVPLLAVCGNLIVGRRAALLAALFLAINPWHVYWSQNARAYVLVCMFAVLAAGTFWLGVQRRSRAVLATGVLLALAAGSCHATGLLLLPVFAVYPLLAAGNLAGRRIALIAVVAGIGVTLLPSLVELLPFLDVHRKSHPDASFVHLAQTTAFYFRLPLLLTALLGLWLLLHQRLAGRVLFLACWALVPLLLLGIVGSTMVKVTARYALAALPAVLLLAGAASVRIGEALIAGLVTGRRSFRLLPAALVPLILVVDMAAYDYLYYAVQHGDRGRWQEAGRVVQRGSGERPFAVCTTHEPVLMYYLRPNNYRSETNRRSEVGPLVFSIEQENLYRVDPATGVRGDGGSYLRSAIGNAGADGRELWVVAALPELIEKDDDGSLRRALREQCELVEVLPCWVGPKDETIYVWRARR